MTEILIYLILNFNNFHLTHHNTILPNRLYTSTLYIHQDSWILNPHLTVIILLNLFWNKVWESKSSLYSLLENRIKLFLSIFRILSGNLLHETLWFVFEFVVLEKRLERDMKMRMQQIEININSKTYTLALECLV